MVLNSDPIPALRREPKINTIFLLKIQGGPLKVSAYKLAKENRPRMKGSLFDIPLGRCSDHSIW